MALILGWNRITADRSDDSVDISDAYNYVAQMWMNVKKNWRFSMEWEPQVKSYENMKNIRLSNF